MSTIGVGGSLWSVPREEQAALANGAVKAGLRRVHWDHADGHFATAGGFDAGRAFELAVELAQSGADLAHEAHLMFIDTIGQVDFWTDVCDRIIVHIELPDWRDAVTRIEHRGCEPLVAISPGTPAHAAPDELGVLCMSVTPGHAGSLFDRTALQKVRELADRNSDRAIGLDGGVRREHVEEASTAGATWLVVGNDLFGAGGLERWREVLSAV